uniref:Solute carrier family 7 member 11 n=1 Tax=Erpetoichthys calabaricus TaxID=27687 RepID=A0A8C4X5G6_ERPCA
MANTGTVYLRKKVNLLGSLCLIVGSIVGSGIFIAPKGVLKNSGSVGMSLIIWLATGIFSTFGALCYAELGTSIKKSGGHYIYLLETLGPLPAFLRLWVEFIIIRPAASSVVALAFGRYILEPFFSPCPAPEVLVKMVSIMGVCKLSFDFPMVLFHACFKSQPHTKLIIMISLLPKEQILLFNYCSISVKTLSKIIVRFIFFSNHALFYIIKDVLYVQLMVFLTFSQYPIMVFMILAGELFGLINFYSFPRWLFIGLTTMGLMIHRYQNPDLPRPFKVLILLFTLYDRYCDSILAKVSASIVGVMAAISCSMFFCNCSSVQGLFLYTFSISSMPHSFVHLSRNTVTFILFGLLHY